MCSRPRAARLLAACALALAGCGGSDERTTLTASLSSVEPACGGTATDTPVTLRGAMPVKPVISVSGGSESSLETQYRAWVGDVELVDVRWVDAGSISATVPAGVTPGTYAVTIESPFGDRTSIDALFEVVAGFCNPASAALRIEASAAPAVVGVGDRVVVTVNVRNTGQATATGVTTAVAGPPGLKLSTSPTDPLDIPGGESRSFTWTYTAEAGAGSGTFAVTAAGLDSSSGESVSAPEAATDRVAVAYLVGGTVSNLTGSGLVLQLNGAGDLPVTQNGSFTFAGAAVPSGAAYAVSIRTQPTGNTCRVIGGTGSVTTANVTQVQVNCDPNSMALSVGFTGNGTGSVLCNNAPCAPTYTFGTVVAITPTASASSTFAGWTGDCNGTGACTVTMNADHAVAATFTLRTMTVTVTKSGNGSGTVTGAPGALDCGTTCSASYDYGTPITLTAAAGTGSTFGGWSGGGCAGASLTCALTMDQARSVTATFTLNTYGVTITQTAGGTVSGPSTVQHGATATYTATANTGFTLTAWSCPGTAAGDTCTVTNVTGPFAVSATFTQNSYPVTITQTAGGEIAGPTTVLHGETATYTATANTGFTLTAWTCPGTATGNTCTVTNVTGPFAVSATFALNTYAVTITQTAGGTVSGPSSVQHGATATYTATPNTGFTLGTWTCPGTAAGDTCTVTNVTAPFAVSATFAPIFYPVTYPATVNGTVSGPSSVQHGTSATFTATPSAGYSVGTWSGCTAAVGATTCTVASVTGPLTVSATFVPIPFTVGGTISGAGLGGNDRVTLQLNVDGVARDTVSAARPSFVFPTAVFIGQRYDVTLVAEPAGFICQVASGGSGTMGTANVTNVAVTCLQLAP